MNYLLLRSDCLPFGVRAIGSCNILVRDLEVVLDGDGRGVADPFTGDFHAVNLHQLGLPA